MQDPIIDRKDLAKFEHKPKEPDDHIDWDAEVRRYGPLALAAWIVVVLGGMLLWATVIALFVGWWA